MKIKPEHYDFIKNEIKEHITLNDWSKHREALKEAHRTKAQNIKNLDVRTAFDCLYACRLSSWVCDNIYPYMNDEQLKTALLKIQKELFQ